MNPFFVQILTLLVVPPGSLAYHLVLAFSIAGALPSAFILWRRPPSSFGLRTILGLSLLLLGRLVLFAFAGLALQGVGSLSLERLLPPLDISVTVLSLILVVWLWAFPGPARLADASTFLLILLGLVLSVFTVVWWGAQPSLLYFSGSFADVLWQAFALAILVLGWIFLLLRRPNGWGIGLGMLGLLFLGHLLQLIQPMAESQYGGAVRLMQMAAYPLLLALPHRFGQHQMSAEAKKEVEAVEASSRLPESKIHLFSPLLTEADPGTITRLLVEGIAQWMQAEVTLLASALPDRKGIHIHCGYDLTNQRHLGDLPLDEHEHPDLAAAISQGRVLRANEKTLPGLRSLIHAIRLPTAMVELLCVPMSLPGIPTTASVLLLTTSEHAWTAEDQTQLLALTGFLGELLRLSQKRMSVEASLSQEREALKEAQAQLEQIQIQRNELVSQLATLQEQLSQERARSESLAALVATHASLQEALANLQAENEYLKKQAFVQAREGQAVPVEVEHLENELRQALEEVAHLRVALAEADRKILALEKQSNQKHLTGEHGGLILSLAQELRQPLSSVLGYTNLLLGESVGILGTLQRKFLERIKTATERMENMLEEIIQASLRDEQPTRLAQERVEVKAAMDEAVASMQTLLSEKGIILKMDIPDQLPALYADRDALRRILVHLLQNACTVSPEGEEIALQVRVEKEQGQDYILWQVVDKGGGIPPDEIPRIFSRLYRADSTPIPGLGDSGVGLSIVKTLVEAHGGRIWVDSTPGVGSRFSVLLPAAIVPDKDADQPEEGDRNDERSAS